MRDHLIRCIVVEHGGSHLAKPGVLAPAQAYDPADFLGFHAPHGVRWTIEKD